MSDSWSNKLQVAAFVESEHGPEGERRQVERQREETESSDDDDII